MLKKRKNISYKDTLPGMRNPAIRLKKALRAKALDRSLEVTSPEDVYHRLEKEMEAAGGKQQ